MHLDGERRRHFRIPLRLPVRHRVAGRDFEDSIALDIHQNGVFILSEELPDVGTAINLNFTIPETDQLVRVKGDVRWVIDRQPNHESGMGVKFEKPVSFVMPIKLVSQYMDNNLAAFVDYARHPFYPEIQQLKNLNNHVINSVNNGVIILDEEFVIRNYNPKQCAAFIPEKQKVIGRPIWEVNKLFNLRYQEKTFKDILQEVLGGKSYRIKNVSYEPPLKESNNNYLDLELRSVIEASGAVSGIIIVIQDVSKERQWSLREKELESLLIEQSRHSSVGLIIKGLLNNMVNPLSSIQGRLELLNLEMQAGKNNLADSSHSAQGIDKLDKYIEGLRMIGHNVQILSDLCRNFMTRIKKEQDTMPRLLNLNDIIMNEIMFLEANQKFRYEINKKLALAKDLPFIWGAYIDFSQLIFNLLDYCIKAMNLSDKKELFISTGFENNMICLDIRHSGTASMQAPQNNFLLCLLNLLRKKYNFDLSVQEQYSNTIFSLRIPVSEN
ncbi:MAG: PilZ domain-containing protein [Thermodesulfobacteriota bacterium]|nr:PilZ domain-containing protein [Thermodesulfobacteriota bacterium]